MYSVFIHSLYNVCMEYFPRFLANSRSHSFVGPRLSVCRKRARNLFIVVFVSIWNGIRNQAKWFDS